MLLLATILLLLWLLHPWLPQFALAAPGSLTALLVGLKLGAFGYMVQTPGVPFYVVLLLSFVAGGLFATLYFLAEKVRLASGMRSLQNKVNALEKQMAQQKKSTVATPPSFAAVAPAPAPTGEPQKAEA